MVELDEVAASIGADGNGDRSCRTGILGERDAGFFQTLKFLFDVGDFKGGQWNSLREHCLLKGFGGRIGVRLER